MGIEGGDLIDLRLRHAHLLGQRNQMARRQMPVLVLDQMQELDQQIGAARLIAEQRAHVFERGVIELAPLRRAPPLAGTGLPDALLVFQRCHGRLPRSSHLPLLE